MKIPTPTIVSVQFSEFPKDIFDAMPSVIATFSNGQTKTLFSFYPDEISFTEDELIGLTEQGARELRDEKDVMYLQS